MSEENKPQQENPIESIFDGPMEAPEEGAQFIDESSESSEIEKVVTEDGHLKVRVPTGGIDPYDHSNEQKALRDHQQKEGTAPPPLPETQVEPIRNPGMMFDPSDTLRDEMERRFAEEVGDMKVEVTAAEREAFVRAALHDEEFLVDVQLEGIDTVVRVAVAPDEFTASAAAALTSWVSDGFITKGMDLQWLLAFQQIHAWYQIRAIDGVPTPWSDYWVDGMPSIVEVRSTMRDALNFTQFFEMNAVRWRMMMDAIRITEAKYKICMRNWRDRSFFTGADTD